jgi:uncharacterized protein YndB with AHSA1/START domain
MSTFGLTNQQRELHLGDRDRRHAPFFQPWYINMQVSVNADRHRLFQALTLPEYIETWVRFPGAKAGQHISVTCTQQSYSILGICGDNLLGCIAGSYRMSRRSKMVFTWRKGASANASLSLVTIRLLGDFARTMLSLSHSGLRSETEFRWQQAFWNASLERLSALF